MRKKTKEEGDYDDVPTSRGNQFCHRAQDRIINRKPTASTNDRRITALGKVSLLRNKIHTERKYSVVRHPLSLC
jgi:hypothetical protein